MLSMGDRAEVKWLNAAGVLQESGVSYDIIAK